MRNILFIVNPVAGKGTGKSYIKTIHDYMSNANCDYQVKVSSRVGNVTELAEWGCAHDFTDIISVGGDGTLIEALNGLDLTKDICLGIIPSGTGNDFARVLNLSKDPLDCLDVIIKRQFKVSDVGLINNKRFINTCGCGIDSQILMDTNRIKKAVHGPTAYLLSTIKNLATYNSKKVKIRIDEMEFTKNAILIAIANGKYFGGGMMIAPDAEIDDGLLEICIVNHLSKSKLLALFPSIFKGTHIHIKPTVEMYKGKEITIENIEGEMVANGDGNLIGTTPLNVKIIDKKLKVIFKDPQN